MLIRLAVCSAAFIASSLSIASPAAAGTDAYLGEIIMGGWNFCPRGTIKADGQLLPISQNSALFSLYGTNYGGDGRTTFAMPDLRGRTPINAGQGPGLPNRTLGSRTTSSNGESGANGGTVAIMYCVVSQGIFPPRS